MVDTIINIVYALGIAGVAIWVSGLAKDRIERAPNLSERIDPTLVNFLGSVARWGILALAGIFILGRLGIETTSLAAAVGAAGIAIGLALQGSLSNFAAGIMLIAFRPFKVGDYINAAGQAGTVDAIALFATELTTPDHVKIIVPNGDIFSSAIINYSHYDTRRCDLIFGVSFDSDLEKAEKIIRECIEADTRTHDDPEPFVKVGNLGASSVDFTVRVWCNSQDYWNLKFDMTRAVKEAFDKGGIEIPFPTTVEIRKTA